MRLARSATATATGLDPHTTICGRGSTGSTKMSIEPWLGHILLAKRTPPVSSPDDTPCSASRSGGCTETRRERPSASASRAALSTAARAQPPPIQPSEMVPSGRITALAPAFAAVAATVRTTVASANGSPAALRLEMVPRISSARAMNSYPCEIGLERREAREIVGRREQVDKGQRRLHSPRARAVVAPAEQRVEPDDAPAAPPQAAHLGREPLGLAGVVAVGDDHHGGARIDDAPRVPAVEGREALADAGAAADALRHERELVHRARDIAVAQRGGDMREAGVEDEGLGLPKGIDHTVQEAHEERGVEAHGAGGVEQEHETQRLDLAAAPLLAPHQARAHHAREADRERMGARDVGRVDDVAHVDGREVLDAGCALAPAATVAGGDPVRIIPALGPVRQAGLALRRR